MAKILLNSVVIFTSSTLVTCNNKPDTFCQSISPSSLGLQNVKLSHIRVFRQDYLSVLLAGPTTANSSTTPNFGSLFAIDTPLTKDLDRNSKQVGRLQGLDVIGGTGCYRVLSSWLNSLVRSLPLVALQKIPPAAFCVCSFLWTIRLSSR
ncbi:hypothetical protein ACFE04_012912 [Oxalis oulophora]